MSKDAVIRFRCSSTLKARLQALADKREQDLSDYLRLKTIDLVQEEEIRLGIKHEPAPDAGGKTITSELKRQLKKRDAGARGSTAPSAPKSRPR